MPRYYKDKIYSKDERAFIGAKQKARLSQQPKLTEQQRVDTLKTLLKQQERSRLEATL